MQFGYRVNPITGQQVQVGRVTGSHLHQEVRVNGSRTDAMSYFS